jgi:hypothetical protein
MSIGLGDEQLDVDDLGRMDDRPRQGLRFVRLAEITSHA